MKVIVYLTAEEEVKALPILLRHSPGMVLPHRTYVLSEAALRALRDASVRFSELSRGPSETLNTARRFRICLATCNARRN